MILSLKQIYFDQQKIPSMLQIQFVRHESILHVIPLYLQKNKIRFYKKKLIIFSINKYIYHH